MSFKRRSYSNGETVLNRDENDAEEGTEHDNKVELIHLPNGVGGGDVDEANNGGDDDGGQHQIGRVLKQRHQKQERDHYCDGHYDVRHGGFGPRVMVHRGPGEGAYK